MKEWLTFIAENAVVVVNAIALVVIVIGTIEAFLRSTRAIFRRSVTSQELRGAYLKYARWLVAGPDFPDCRGRHRNFYRANVGGNRAPWRYRCYLNVPQPLP
jgi:hypothetical protein